MVFLPQNGEASLESLGLAGWSPPGLLQKLLELVHVSGDLSWGTSIVIGKLSFRFFFILYIVKTLSPASVSFFSGSCSACSALQSSHTPKTRECKVCCCNAPTSISSAENY